MKRLGSLLVLTVVVMCTATARGQTPMAHRFIQVAPGIYSAIGNGTIETRSSNLVIINPDDVFLVDTNITPEATRRLVNDIKTLSDKPIRYVVNTHWHYDHTDGNQVFAPIAAIIGHEYTRRRLSGDILQRGKRKFVRLALK